MLLLLHCGAGVAMTASISSLRSDNIPSDKVTQLIQDSDGFLWIVTYQGLARYDGYQCIDYSHAAKVADCSFLKAVDYGDKLYIGSDKGVHVLDKKTSEMHQIKDGVSENLNVSSIVRDSEGKIWIGSNHGLYRKDIHSDKFYPIALKAANGRSISDIVDLAIDDKGNLWMSSWERGLYRYELASSKLFCYNEGPLAYAYALHFDAQGQLWVGTWGRGLLRIDGDPYSSCSDYTCYSHNASKLNSLLDNVVYDICDGPQGSIWVGSRSGLSVLRDGVFDNYVASDEAGGLPFNEVNSILRTSDGTMWIGMDGGGVCKFVYNEDCYRSISLDPIQRDFHTSTVKSIAAREDGTYWIGINAFGMVSYDFSTESYTHYLDLPQFSDIFHTPTIDNIVRRGEISYFGSYNNGLWIYNEQSKEIKVINSTTYPNMTDDVVLSLEQDSTGRIWFSTRKDVLILDTDYSLKTLAQLINSPENISYPSVFDICCDSEGKLWMASASDGLLSYTEKRQTQDYSLAQQSWSKLDKYMTSTAFSSLYCDTKGRLWAGSKSDGLYIYEGAKLSKISSLAMLDGKMIINIAEDAHGAIWLTTNKLALAIDASSPDEVQIRHFANIGSQYKTNSFSSGVAIYLSESDEMLFGCSRGLCAFPCSPKISSDYQAQIVISDLEINNVSYRYIGKEDWHRKNGKSFCDINYISRLYLKHNQNDINIHFSLLDFQEASYDTFHYRLVGASNEDDWRIVDGKANSASFVNLPKGKYRFEVFGKTSNSDTNSEVKSIEIVIFGNPFTQWYSVLAYLAMAAAILYFAISYARSRYRLKRKTEIAELIQAQSDELSQAKSQYVSDLSLEFLSPLHKMTEAIEELIPRTKKDRNTISEISSNAAILARLIKRELANNKEAQGGSKQLVFKLKDVDYTSADQKFLQKALEVVNEHIADSDFSQADFASAMCTSRSVLTEKIKNLTGFTPQALVINTRLTLAYKILLEQKEKIRISDLAYSVGFQDAKYFSKRFKAKYGKSPKDIYDES